MSTPLAYALLVLGALCGYLAWRASGKLLVSAVFALAVPLAIWGGIGIFIAGELSGGLAKTAMLIGVITALGAVVYLNRGK